MSKNLPIQTLPGWGGVGGGGVGWVGEFCFNYRHPDPRRMWKGGPVLQPMTPDPGNNRDPGNPAIVPNRRFVSTKPHVIEKDLPE